MKYGIFDKDGKLDCDPEPMVFETRREAVEVLNSGIYDSTFTVGEVKDRILVIHGDEGGSEWDEEYPTVEKAISEAESLWCHLTAQEKKRGAFVKVAIVDEEEYFFGTIKDIVWENGEAVA